MDKRIIIGVAFGLFATGELVGQSAPKVAGWVTVGLAVSWAVLLLTTELWQERRASRSWKRTVNRSYQQTAGEDRTIPCGCPPGWPQWATTAIGAPPVLTHHDPCLLNPRTPFGLWTSPPSQATAVEPSYGGITTGQEGRSGPSTSSES